MHNLEVLALATLLGLGTACGTVPGAGDDDDTPDAATAAPDAPAIGLATITVYDQGFVASGVSVVFHDPDGTIRATVLSDGSGQAMHEVVLGALVTVVLPRTGGGSSLYTVGGVDPGDEIDMGSRRDESNEIVGSVEIFLPSSAPATTTYANISIGGGCSNGSIDIAPGTPPSSLVLDVSRRCVQSGDRVTIVAEAIGMDASGAAERIAFSVTPFTLGAGMAQVSLPPWRSDWRRSDVVLSNAPPFALAAELFASYFQENALYDFNIGDVVPAANQVTAQAFFPRDVGDQFTLAARITLGDDSTSPDGMVVMWAHSNTAPPPSQEFDLSQMLPRVRNVGYLVADERPTVSLDLDGGEVAADAMVLQIGYNRGPQNNWFMVLPHDTPLPVKYPELPASLAEFAPGLDANFDPPTVFLIDLATTDGYREYKQINTSILEEQGPPKQSGGRVSIGGSFN